MLVRALLGVADLRARNLEDECAGVECLRRGMTARAVSYAMARTLMAGTVKPPALPGPSPCRIVNRRGANAFGGRQRADDPAPVPLMSVVAPNAAVHARRSTTSGVSAATLVTVSWLCRSPWQPQ